jgi:ATP-dependent DNA helicase RecQ
VAKDGAGYRLIAPSARPDYARWEGVTAQRYREMAQMRAYVEHDGCLMRFIAEALDDPNAPEACGRCKHCRGHQSRFQPSIAQIEAAQHFLRAGRPITLEPRKRWPKDLLEIVGQRRTVIRPTNEVGVALCNYFDAGWAAQVKHGRLTANHYSDALVEASAGLLRAHFATLDKPPTWATYVPSLRRPQLVHDFAHRLAAALGLPLYTMIVHDRQHPEQQSRRNSAQKAKNVAGVFALAGRPGRQPVLLIDDIADSGWTLTMTGYLLRKGGSGPVHPFVLATLTAD